MNFPQDGRLDSSMIFGVFVELLASHNRKFPTNNLGEYTWHDGCDIEREMVLGALKMSQEEYVKSLLSRFGMQSTSDILDSPKAMIYDRSGTTSREGLACER